ncbi:MAG: hypothetical protein KAX20_06080 [Candidatus Omnitrophica bacterium]|nr:hypothetical protein [Candidatus Omnitrophota bacterium]
MNKWKTNFVWVGVVTSALLISSTFIFGAPKRKSPTVTIASPEDGAIIPRGTKIEINVNYQAGQGKIYSLELKVDRKPVETKLVVPPATSGSHTFSYSTFSLSEGSHTFSVYAYQTKRPTKGKDSITINISPGLAFPSVEEILWRVESNYTLIQDMKAILIARCTFNSKPFGKTDLALVYTKAPDKMRRETYLPRVKEGEKKKFSSTKMTDRKIKEMRMLIRKDRIKPTDIMITDGSKIIVLNPETMEKMVERDLIKEAGISSSQFDQMDLWYNQDEFIANHSLTLDEENSDSKRGIYALDAVPVTPNKLYSKLRMSIDYEKGIMPKFMLYQKSEEGEEELIQTIEIKRTKKILADKKERKWAYVPARIVNTSPHTVGDLITIQDYLFIRINLGLSDNLFDPEYLK